MTPFAHPPHPHPQPPEKKMITCPRAGALAALDHLDGTDRTLDAVLDDMAPVIHGLSRRDRALFNHLVFGVLRWRLRLDAVIDAHANRPLNRITPTILNIIRIGLYQIQFMDRIPASAAVNTAVGLAKNRQSARAAGFVNALLRNALRNPQRYRAPDAESSPAAHMAAMKSFPRWLVFRWIQRYGIDTAGSLCDAMNTIPPITIRCNLLKNSVTELFDTLKPQVERIVILDDIPCALSLDHPQTPISEMPAFVDGRFAVQDGAAQLISMLLAPQPGETVLDACAGLGGKTTHLAQIMHDQGAVVALDHVGAKLARLEAESQRLGTTTVSTRCADIDRANMAAAFPRFDRILLDAPCTGLGVLRRNPDAKWSSQKKDIARYARRQLRFLERLAPLLKKNGVLVFSVCSMEPEENEQVVFRFLKNHPDFVIDKHQSDAADCVKVYMDRDGFFRTAPHTHNMDGFFAARLKRTRG